MTNFNHEQLKLKIADLFEPSLFETTSPVNPDGLYTFIKDFIYYEVYPEVKEEWITAKKASEASSFIKSIITRDLNDLYRSIYSATNRGEFYIETNNPIRPEVVAVLTNKRFSVLKDGDKYTISWKYE